MKDVFAIDRNLQPAIKNEAKLIPQRGHAKGDEIVINLVDGDLVFLRQREEVREFIPSALKDHAGQPAQRWSGSATDDDPAIHDHGVPRKGADEIEHSLGVGRGERHLSRLAGINHRSVCEHPRILRNPLFQRSFFAEFPRFLGHLHKNPLFFKNHEIMRKLVRILEGDFHRLPWFHPHRGLVIFHQAGLGAQLDGNEWFGSQSGRDKSGRQRRNKSKLHSRIQATGSPAATLESG